MKEKTNRFFDPDAEGGPVLAAPAHIPTLAPAFAGETPSPPSSPTEATETNSRGAGAPPVPSPPPRVVFASSPPGLPSVPAASPPTGDDHMRTGATAPPTAFPHNLAPCGAAQEPAAPSSSSVLIPQGDGMLYGDLDTNAIVPIPVVSGSSGGGSDSGSGTPTGSDSQSAGLIININYDSSVANAPAGFEADVAEAVQFFESEISTPVTLTIDVGYGEIDGQALSSDALGESESYLTETNYTTLRNALIASASDATDATAVASLPAADPTNGAPFLITEANAQALGLIGSGGLDGYVGFATSGFDYDDNGSTVSGYDFLGVVEHEISEVMGRITLDGTLDGGYATEDLFHYSASGVRDFSATTPGYFSIDGGITDLNDFNTNPSGDSGDWSGETNDSANAFSSPNVINPFSTVDLTVMDAIGWTLASPPPATTVTAITETPASGDLDAGHSVMISLTLSAAVTVTGAPTLALNDGGTATYAGGSGSTTLTFAYTVAAGQNTAALAVTAVDLPGGAAVIDGNSDDADLAIAGLTQTGPQIDTTAPAAPVIASDSINADAVTLAGTAEAGSTITVYDAAGALGTAETNGSGDWSYTTAALAAGSYSFTATATDAAGNVSAASAPFVQTISAAPATDATIVLRSSSGDVSLWQVNGTQLLSETTIGSAPSDWQIAGIGSFGGVGGSDLLWENTGGTAGVWQMNGTQVLAETGIGQASSDWQIEGVGNFTGSGMNDIVWQNTSGVVGVWEMNGSQVVTEAGVGVASSGWQIEGVGNFGGTGANDILWENSTDGTVALWQMNGTQVTAETVIGQAASGWQFAGIGDVNGDGTSDIIWQNTNGSVAVWEMSNNQVAAEAIIGQAPSGSTVVGVGDFNGDGKSDILFADSSGTLTLWEMNGTQVASQAVIGQLPSGTQVAAVETNGTTAQSSVALLAQYQAAGLQESTSSGATSTMVTGTETAGAAQTLLVASQNHA